MQEEVNNQGPKKQNPDLAAMDDNWEDDTFNSMSEEILTLESPRRILDEMRAKGAYLLIPSLIDLELQRKHQAIPKHQEEECQDIWKASFQLSFKEALPGATVSQLLCQLQCRLDNSVTVRIWKNDLFPKSKGNMVNVAFCYIGLSHCLKVDVTSRKRLDPTCLELWTRIGQILDVVGTVLDTHSNSITNQEITFSDQEVASFNSPSGSGLTCEWSVEATRDRAIQKIPVISFKDPQCITGRRNLDFLLSDSTDQLKTRQTECNHESLPVYSHNLKDQVERDGCSCQIPTGHESFEYLPRSTIHDGLDKEKDRLNTFRRWPTFANVKPEPLAKAGFHYLGVRDEVECFACRVKCRQWRPGQDPMEVHRTKSPSCPFLLTSKSSGLKTKSPVGSFDQSADTAESTAYVEERTPLGSSTTEATGSLRAIASLENHSIVPLPSDFYAREEHRLGTFRNPNWPSWCPVPVENLARSGFVYTGNQDAVQCFKCGVVLRGWERGDTADGEHRRHSPSCPFLKETEHGLPQSTVKYPDDRMKSEQNRLTSFSNVLWPSKVHIQARDLAEAGLYNIGRGDTTRCFDCHVMINNWEVGDKPIEEHAKSSAGCKFVKRVQQIKQQQELRSRLQSTVISSSPGMLMNTVAARLSSFVNWPQEAPVRPQDLAAAGFYYIGHSDRVQCFSCDISLRGWEPGDTAWSEHARYSPSCEFVRENAPADVHKPIARYDEPWSGNSATTFYSSHSGSQGPFSVSSPSCAPKPAKAAILAAEQTQRPMYQMSSGERARGVNYEFQQKVIEMGFDRAVVERVIARHVQEKGSPYTDLTDLIEDLVAEDARLESTKSPDNSAYGHGRTHSKEQKQLDKELDDSRMPSILSAFHDLQRELNKIHPEEKVTSSNTGLLTASSSQPLQTTRQHKPTSQYQLKPPHSGGKLTTTAPTKNLIPAGSKDARLCKICLDREIAVVFLECAHVVSCEECASKLFECPICRAPIRAKVRAFFA